MEVLHRGPARYEVRAITLPVPRGSTFAKTKALAGAFSEAGAENADAVEILATEPSADGRERTYTFLAFWRDDTETT